MSYNITNLDIKKLSVDVPLSEFLMKLIGNAFREQYTWDDGGITWNENGFVFALDGDGTEIHGELRDKDAVNIFNINVSSAFSSDLLETVQDWCKKYKGTMKGIAVWEGGDSVQRFEIKDGNVIKDEEL